MDGLTRYVVRCVRGAEFGQEVELFSCWADDVDHAREQAINAYPDSIATHVDLAQ